MLAEKDKDLAEQYGELRHRDTYRVKSGWLCARPTAAPISAAA